MTAKDNAREPETSTVKVAMDVSGVLLDLYHHAVDEGGMPRDRFLDGAVTILADAKPLRGHQVDEVLAYVRTRTAPPEPARSSARPVVDAPQA